jgi:NAD(P)H dehydrogenase (quinone)
MNILIVIDHPWQGSYNYAVLIAFQEGLDQSAHQVDLIDLNADEFNPIFSEAELSRYGEGVVLDPVVKDYQARVAKSDYLVFIFPIWWNVMPARMKGWLDKVFTPGFAFTKGQVPAPLLQTIQGASVLTTTGAPDALHREEYHNALHWVLCKGVLDFCGISPVTWLNFGDTGFAPREDHCAWLDEVREHAKGLLD